MTPKNKEKTMPDHMKAKDRPKVINGVTHKMNTGCGNLYVTVNIIDNDVFEVFAKLGKSGGCSACQIEALTRVISIGLRAGVELQEYEHTLSGIRCQSPALDEGEQIMSCPDAISKVMREYLKRESDSNA